MSIPVVYTDSDKSKYYSTNDYTFLSDYHHSFYNAKQTSQLRMVIAPGTVKYFNQSFTPEAINTIKNPIYATESKIVPIPSFISNGTNDDFDYMSYSQK